MTHRLAIFDCDGTLVDSQANICMAMEHAFEGAGLTPPRRHDIRRVVGLSLVESMRVLLPDAEDKCHQDMAEHYRTAFLTLRNNGLVDEPLYDGMASLLSEMDACASEEHRMVVLLPVSGGSRTNGRDLSPSGLKPKHPENGLKRR